MSALWTASTAKAATGGAGPDGWEAAGVAIDSRQVQPGDLFIALAGPNHDGHDHVAAALEAGAAAAMVSRRPAGLAADAPLLLVNDTQAGLEALARAARARFQGKVIALTGSVGKTGTKEMLRLVLSAQGKTSATLGNLNNHIGAPLTLARLAADADYAVLELGMNHAGEIGPLSRMVRPDVALITRIAAAHTEFFASLTEVAAAKAEIFEGLKPGGTAIVNADDDFAGMLATAASQAGAGQVVRFGGAEGADVRLLDLVLQSDGSDMEVQLMGRWFVCHIGAPGRHWVMNSLGVLAAVASAGADPARAVDALADVRAPAGRGATGTLTLPQGPITLIDESYNASPAAMRAAFAVLTAHRPGGSGRRVAVLGDMLELGENAPREHRELGEILASLPVDRVFAAGPEMPALVSALLPQQRAGYAADTAALAEQVVPALRGGDVVLVKGSLGIGMAKVMNALRAAAAGAGAPEEIKNAL
jgi:UDP-N-acetylmuramoyl-tripeptide--D-alanyl-D-alanine ligase